MLINRPQGRIVEKILKNNEGFFVRAYFAVLEWEGQIYVKLIRTEDIYSQNSSCSNSESFRPEGKCCLAAPYIISFSDEEISIPEYQSSPFKDFSFLTSQLTRAPSIK